MGKGDVLAAGGAAATGSGASDRNALQLQLQDLRLDNVDALELLKLNIQARPPSLGREHHAQPQDGRLHSCNPTRPLILLWIRTCNVGAACSKPNALL